MDDVKILMMALGETMKTVAVSIEEPVSKLLSVIDPIADMLSVADVEGGLSIKVRQIVADLFIAELMSQCQERTRVMHPSAITDVYDVVRKHICSSMVAKKAAVYMNRNEFDVKQVTQEHGSMEEAIASYVIGVVLHAVHCEVDKAVLSFKDHFEHPEWRIFRVSTEMTHANVLMVADHGDYRILDWTRIQEEAAEKSEE